MFVLLFSVLMHAHASRPDCGGWLGDREQLLARMYEYKLISDYRWRFTTVEAAEPVLSPWRQRLARARSHRYVALLGPGEVNVVFRVDDTDIHELSPRDRRIKRVRTAAGDLEPGTNGWTWVGGVPAWYTEARIDRAAFETHFAAVIHHLVVERELLTRAESDRAELAQASYAGRELVYAQIERDGRPLFILFDVATRAVFFDFEDRGEDAPAVEIPGRGRLRPHRRGFVTVPAEGWAARVAPRIEDLPLRTLFERFGTEVDQLFLAPEPPADGALLAARVSAVTGAETWRPCVAITLADRTLYFDPRERRWLNREQLREEIDRVNEDLPRSETSPIHSDSATFGPERARPIPGGRRLDEG